MEGRIVLAKIEDKEKILSLYKSMLYGPAKWNDHYPSEETIDFDISRDALYIMKNDNGEIIAALSVDDDEEVRKLSCWRKDLLPGAEISRLCVRKDMQNKGISKVMMRHVFKELSAIGYKSVHILVVNTHKVAITSYTSLGFIQVGECAMYERDFICMEIRI